MTMTTLQEAAQAAMKYIRSTADYKAGHPVAIEAAEDLSDALAQHREQQPVCHGCGIPVGDVHMSTCKSGKWPSRVSNGDTAAPAPQPAQGVPEVGFGNMPYSPYLFGGLRFKMNFDKSGNATNFHGVESSLQGAWVALVDATDNRHLQSAQPVAPYDKTEMNAFVQDLYDKKMQEGKHGFYETLFHVVHKAIARVGIREVK